MTSATKAEVRTIRCAIYTRKSTEEGLDQEFNSLDAQREAAENYIASQQREGWVAIPKHYDDGGFSGGNLERPAMNRMLADISNGEVDCVVVYKVDRLSRSLLDFSQIMGAFDRQGVWFVSVTQAFNTTHSMGRLTLNILLSFAQFEREIIGRIKHKAECYNGEHTAIVDEKLFDEVGAMLRSHARGGGGHLCNKYHSLLRGLLFCPACNRSMVHNVSKRGAKVYRYYTCVTAIKRGRKHCPSPSLPAAVIESAVVGQVRSIATDAGLRRDVLQQALEQVGDELDELQTQQSQLKTQLARAEEQIQDVITRKEPNASPRLVELHEQRETTRRSLARVDAEVTQLKAERVNEMDVNTAFSDFDNVWNSLNTLEKSEVLTLLVSRIEFDAADSSLSIEMHPSGIKSLATNLEDSES